MVTLVASAGVLNGTTGAQSWSEDVTISALAPNGSAAAITHATNGFGVQGGRLNTQIDHIPTNNTSEQFIIDFSGPVQDVVLQFGLMNADERGGNRETGSWTAFDVSGNQVASGVLDPANGTLVGNLTYDIPIDAGGQSFTKLLLNATGYNSGTTGISGDSSDFAVKQLTYTPTGTSGGQPSSASISVTQNGGLNASTFGNGSFVITNDLASSQDIQSVTFDIRPSLLPGMVYDPAGTAGDDVAKAFTPNSGSTTTGLAGHSFSNPLDPSDPDGDSDGWRTLKVDFTGFDPGETFTFSIDVDPASIKGTSQPGPHASGSVSGLELVGSDITVQYGDGSTATGELFVVPGSSGGAKVLVSTEAVPPEPTVSVVGVGSGPATVSDAAQQVVVTGPVDAAVRLLVVEGGGFTETTVSPDALPLGSFDANSAVKVTEYSGTIGANGSATIPIQLTKTAVQLETGESGDTGLNYITAALVDANGNTGPAASPVILEFEPGGTPPPPPDGVVAAINAGGGVFTAGDGTAYSADAFFGGGKTFSTTAAIAGTTDDALYQNERFQKGGLSYDIPVADGDYLVTLQFAEIFFTAPGQRVFDVALEGAVPPQVNDLDVVAEVGPNAAHDVTVPVSVTDGNLDIDFLAQVQNPKVNAIRVAAADGAPGTQPPNDIQLSADTFDENAAFAATLSATDPDSDPPFTFSILNEPGDPPPEFQISGDELQLVAPLDFENLPSGFTVQGSSATIDLTLGVEDESGNAFSEVVTLTVNDVDEGTPGAVVAAINAGGGAFTATDGTAYSADAFFAGGKTFSTTAAIAGTTDDTLYQNERFQSGGLSYNIPVANGDYQVTLQFAEIFFTQPGQRVFDVALEGAVPPQVNDLDVVAQVGPNAAHDVTVPVTVTDGNLDIDFLAQVQNPKVNAIRVTAADGTPPPPPPPGTINFDVDTLANENVSQPTSIQFGPDGRLYVSGLKGLIHVYDVAETAAGGYQVTASETINLIQQIPNHNDDGGLNTSQTQRQITGIVVTGTADDPVIYVSSSDPRWGGGASNGDVNLDTNSGIISRLTQTSGGGWQKLDLVRGLPRSEENHSTNGLQYDPATNTLLVAQGGHTNAGAPSQKFAFLNEFALSAAVLAIDLDLIGNTTYDIPTVNDPTVANDPATPFGGNDGLNMAKLVAGGPVQIFSPGFRNIYDLVVTESGQIYTIDNGPNPTWGGWPTNEGPNGTATNEYNSSEPGSNQVNNLDGLHLIGTIDSPGYYGGHPDPIRANPSGAGLYTDNDQGTALWRSTPSQLPADWPPVPQANPIEGDFQMPGVENDSLFEWNGLSVNGLDEYTSGAFGGQMQNDLLAAALDADSIFRMQLNAAGTQVTDVTTLASNFAGNPVDVIAQGDGDPFPGTFWVASLDGKITIFTPAGGGGGAGDADGDGYSDADEIANGTDPNNAADKPPDFDADFVSDLNDSDDDADGSNDPLDHFARDAANGTNVVITSDEGLFYPMFGTDPGTGLFGLGFTGLMNNGTTDYLNQFVKDNLIPGGATGTFTIVNTTSGDAIGTNNTQDNGFQFGVDISSVSAATITARILNPFQSQTPEDWQSAGIQIGTGDQDNYLKIVVSALGPNNPVGFQVVYEENGAVVTAQNFVDTAIVGASSIDLFLDVEPTTGLVTPSWEYTNSSGQLVSGSGNPIAVSGNVLAALQGTYQNQGTASGLAVGAINTDWKASSPIEASYDHFAVFADPGSTVATAALVPTTSSAQTQQFSDAALTSTSSDETPQLSDAELAVAQVVDDYEDIEFEIINGRTQPGGLPKPGALIARDDDGLQLDTTDVLLFGGNDFDILQDLGPGTVANIKRGVAKGVLEDVFDRVPGQGPPDDLFVFDATKASPAVGKVAAATTSLASPDLSTLLQDDTSADDEDSMLVGSGFDDGLVDSVVIA